MLGIAVAVIAGIVLVFVLNRTDALKEEASGTMQKRLDYWTATVHMIRDHPWLGVGPGQILNVTFTPDDTAFLSASAQVKINVV